VAKAYGSTVGFSGSDPRLDINGDGEVDITDLFFAAEHYGEVYS
jgi:hypothetical protein